MSEHVSYAQLPVAEFLDALAAGKTAPAGGSAVALVLAQAAALCAKTARLSARQLTADRAGQLSAEADRIRESATALIDEDARAYAEVIAQSRRLADDPGRPVTQLAAALSLAADVPMLLVELAGGVAELAADLVLAGNPALRGDATAAALLAQAAAQAAATLVRINLADSPDDIRPARAGRVLARIARSASSLG